MHLFLAGLITDSTQLICCAGDGSDDVFLEAVALVDELPPLEGAGLSAQDAAAASGCISEACWKAAVAHLQQQLASLGSKAQVSLPETGVVCSVTAVGGKLLASSSSSSSRTYRPLRHAFNCSAHGSK